MKGSVPFLRHRLCRRLPSAPHHRVSDCKHPCDHECRGEAGRTLLHSLCRRAFRRGRRFESIMARKDDRGFGCWYDLHADGAGWSVCVRYTITGYTGNPYSPTILAWYASIRIGDPLSHRYKHEEDAGERHRDRDREVSEGTVWCGVWHVSMLPSSSTSISAGVGGVSWFIALICDPFKPPVTSL